MKYLAFILLLVLPGCQFDPYSAYFTLHRPKEQDLVGVYVPDANTKKDITASHDLQAEPSIELKADGSLEIKNFPDWMYGSHVESRGALNSGHGTWVIAKHQEWWCIFVDIKSTADAADGLPAGDLMLAGEKAPYKIILTIGDPDQGNAMVFENVNAPPGSIADVPDTGAVDLFYFLGSLAFLAIVGMVVVVVAVAGCFVLLLGVAAVTGVVLFVLVAGGILSSSFVFGVMRRSTGSAFRALFLQLGAATGIPCGIAAAWLGCWLTQRNWSPQKIILAGGGTGLVFGAAAAILFNLAWSRLVALAIGRFENWRLARRHSPRPAIVDPDVPPAS